MMHEPTTAIVPPRVVCAAIKLNSGTIICGARHFDKTMRNVIDAMGNPDLVIRGAEQGFIDQFGNFLTREQAYDIAYVNKQIIRDRTKYLGTLYSEHLY